MENNNFVWNDFGRLKGVSNDDSMVYITNTEGKTLKMSKRKYKKSALIVQSKAENLVNHSVQVRTSQNTANWSSAEWFSDIK